MNYVIRVFSILSWWMKPQNLTSECRNLMCLQGSSLKQSSMLSWNASSHIILDGPPLRSFSGGFPQRSELWRQVRLYQDWLSATCYDRYPPWLAESKMRHIKRTTAHLTELWWSSYLSSLAAAFRHGGSYLLVLLLHTSHG
ncbi:uncharacterized protein LOC144101957 isoform X2 [Amblyomma americanum]